MKPESRIKGRGLVKDKSQIRKEVIARRDSISEELKKTKDSKIRDTLFELPEFKSSRVVLLYASFKSEADTFELIKYCLSNGKSVVLPKVDKTAGGLLLYEIKDLKELVRGHFGVPEPSVTEERRRDISEIDIVIVPGVAFDEQCNRLGYGKGFYDKLLFGKKCRTIALAYEEQIVESIPSEPHDVKIGRIITDKRTINCGP